MMPFRANLETLSGKDSLADARLGWVIRGFRRAPPALCFCG